MNTDGNQTDLEGGNDTIPVEVAHAAADRQLIIPLRVAPGTTAYEAVRLSGICAEFPAIDPDKDPMGVFSHKLDGKHLPIPREYRLRPGDRVEIYRPLRLDPKLARRRRARREKTGADD